MNIIVLSVRISVIIAVLSIFSLSAQSPFVRSKLGNDSSWTVHLKAGIPLDDDPTDEILVFKPQYVLSYCPAKNSANWVAWELRSSWYGDVPRYKGNFMTDPLLPDSFYRVRHTDYTNSGFDRGHMVRSEERTATAEDNKATFYLSNVLPQAPDLNRGAWLDFEYYCEHLCKQENKTLYVYAGGVYHSDSTLKGDGKVAVPDSCFKIVLVLEYGQHISELTENSTVIAVLMPNKNGIRNEPWQKYSTTVRKIEQSTGYDFFSALSKELQDFLETRQYNCKKK